MGQAPVPSYVLPKCSESSAPKSQMHEIVAILNRLGFELIPEPGSPPEFFARIPTWRLDIEREIDLIEEIAGLHG